MISGRMSAAEFRANREADITERPSKYRNKMTTVDVIKFDSKRELMRAIYGIDVEVIR
ncbi:hypothetical protein [Sinorhizobium medicae]|uniref:hypothetical protein n=1 Tax=Sinorhizobium medicae TaxID=110321 RepID=UPI0013E2D5DE|nr:hypothetical protein [Sinorhizobium medicae]WQO60636.1 hypothetical protein U8C35_09655 [Sinorhizobium medicae]